jgi:hypothetical protein
VLWIRTLFFGVGSTNFFSDSDSVSDSDPYTNILTRNFFKMAPLIAFICVLESVRQRKKFSNWNTYVLSLSSVWSAIFHTKNFTLQQSLDPNPNPNFFSDSDPAKIFGIFRIRIHKTGKRDRYWYRYWNILNNVIPFLLRPSCRSVSRCDGCRSCCRPARWEGTWRPHAAAAEIEQYKVHVHMLIIGEQLLGTWDSNRSWAMGIAVMHQYW